MRSRNNITRLRYTIPTNNQPLKDNMRDDIFLPFDAEGNFADPNTLDQLEYLGFDGENYIYADGKGKKFFSKVFKGIGKGIKGAARGVAKAAKWTVKTISQWGKEAKKNRAERYYNRQKIKAEKKAKAEEEAKNKGLTGEQKDKFVQQNLAQTDAAANNVENKITTAEQAAYDATLKQTNGNQEAAEKAALQAGEVATQQILATGSELEKQIVSGTATSAKVSFWQSMGTGGKIAIIAGGAIVLFLGVYAIVKASKSK